MDDKEKAALFKALTDLTDAAKKLVKRPLSVEQLVKLSEALTASDKLLAQINGPAYTTSFNQRLYYRGKPAWSYMAELRCIEAQRQLHDAEQRRGHDGQRD